MMIQRRNQMLAQYAYAEASGLNIAITDGIKPRYHLPYIKAECLSTQDGTPTPSNPISIADTAAVVTASGGDLTPCIATISGSGIGDYRDSVEVVGGRVIKTQRIGTKVFNGTENWRPGGLNQYNLYRSYISRSSSDIRAANDMAAVCSHFRVIDYSSIAAAETEAMALTSQNGTNTGIQIQLSTSDAKGYFAALYAAGTPVTLRYSLATPIVTDITDTPEGQAWLGLHTYGDVTTVSVTGANPQPVALKYLKHS